LVVDFEFTEPPATARQQDLAMHLKGALWPDQAIPIEVSVAGRLAILQGVVGAERDRQLAERLALLEPGIAEVRNELRVRSPAARDESAVPDGSPASPRR
jgi:osmotically-inducible protein OsmY